MLISHTRLLHRKLYREKSRKPKETLLDASLSPAPPAAG
ncbi:hypothetical protein FM102_07630 [Corynebacterium glutamicum]|nr:hypothetical protein FM102_07630 [Corynebacterium glutamicum]